MPPNTHETVGMHARTQHIILITRARGACVFITLWFYISVVAEICRCGGVALNVHMRPTARKKNVFDSAMRCRDEVRGERMWCGCDQQPRNNCARARSTYPAHLPAPTSAKFLGKSPAFTLFPSRDKAQVCVPLIPPKELLTAFRLEQFDSKNITMLHSAVAFFMVSFSCGRRPAKCGADGELWTPRGERRMRIRGA